MLYTLSSSQSNITDIENILSKITEQDAVILWQDGVLQAVRYPQLFAGIENVFILKQDLLARGLHPKQFDFTFAKIITLSQLIEVTDKYSPQITLF